MAHLHFTCWNCGANCVVHGDYCGCCDSVDVPTTWECWDCGAVNETPED